MIEACLAKGWSVSQAARHYGMHKSSIDAACERFGIALPMHQFSPQMPSIRRSPIVVWEDNIDDGERREPAFSASPAAIERALKRIGKSP